MVFRTFFPLALVLAPAPLFAQAMVQPLGLTDADALAEQVRRLGANPRDIDALLTAAELSVRLDDLSAAGAFLARAEKVMPPGARGQAVRGAILVRSERPGEALRQFAQAEAMGLNPARFAADRGLAYDLIGEQRRAQADYRLALKGDGANDEVRRWLGLSLGILGKSREALDELAPLVRKNDRGAWRARAFVLAMSGDATEALKIAQTMMPPGSAQGLQGFFAELPRLPAIDRAFAVHFGEVRPTPQRLADARLVPQLAPLPQESAPVQVAVLPPAPARDKGKRSKPKVGRVALTEPAPVQVAIADPVTQPPAYQTPVYQQPTYGASVRTPAVMALNSADRPLTPGEQASLAAATLRPARSRSRAASVITPTAAAMPPISRPVEIAAVTPRPAPVVAATMRATTSTQNVAPAKLTPPLATAPLAVTPAPSILMTLPVAGPPAPAPSLASTATASLASSPVPVLAADNRSPAATVAPGLSQPIATAPAPLLTPAPVRVAATPPPRISRVRADDILAKIVANLSIPASELGIAKPAPSARPSRSAARLLPEKEEAPAKTLAGKKDDAQAWKLASRKELADRKGAAEKKAIADKAAAEKKATRAEPARIWVQVAGGANVGDLGKAWTGVRARARGAFAGRQGYTTPSRATNRVLTGPFKTAAEARAYVNQLTKIGVSAFSFTSDPGQKVSRLDTK